MTKRPIVADVLVEMDGIDRTKGCVVGNELKEDVGSKSEKGDNNDGDPPGENSATSHCV